MFALVDCNNFFASCEAIFNPSMRGKPLVVLSSNDGCVIARSRQAKALGIPMGAPYFKYKELFSRNGVKIFSSNFSLYGQMSNRVVQTIATFGHPLEIYSIDEVFLSLPQYDLKTLSQIACEISHKVYKWTGIEVSIGIAPTKTLAKAANKIAKESNGVFIFSDMPTVDAHLKVTKVEEIWGIGRRQSRFLKMHGIDTAFKLKTQSDIWIKKNLKVIGLRLVWELRGKPCLSLEKAPQKKKSLVVSRSFKTPIEDFDELLKTLASFAALGAKKLRKQDLKAKSLVIFIATSPFGNTPYLFESTSCTFPVQTAYTPTILSSVRQMLNSIYQKNAAYKRAGIRFDHLTSSDQIQLDLLQQDNLIQNDKQMQILDQINVKYKDKILFFASEGKQNASEVAASSYCSPRYLSSWDELPIAKI